MAISPLMTTWKKRLSYRKERNIYFLLFSHNFQDLSFGTKNSMEVGSILFGLFQGYLFVLFFGLSFANESFTKQINKQSKIFIVYTHLLFN
jgi:hypothetical protein